MSKKDIDTNQMCTIPYKDILHSVITLKEAASILKVSESTLRTRIIKGDFEDWEYRKSCGTILFCKLAIEKRKNTFRKR